MEAAELLGMGAASRAWGSAPEDDDHPRITEVFADGTHAAEEDLLELEAAT